MRNKSSQVQYLPKSKTVRTKTFESESELDTQMIRQHTPDSGATS